MMKRLFPFVALLSVLVSCGGPKGPSVAIRIPDNANSRMTFGAEQLRSELQKQGCKLVEQDAELVISLSQASSADSLPKEGFDLPPAPSLSREGSNRDYSSLLH